MCLHNKVHSVGVYTFIQVQDIRQNNRLKGGQDPSFPHEDSYCAPWVRQERRECLRAKTPVVRQRFHPRRHEGSYDCRVS